MTAVRLIPLLTSQKPVDVPWAKLGARTDDVCCCFALVTGQNALLQSSKSHSHFRIRNGHFRIRNSLYLIFASRKWIFDSLVRNNSTGFVELVLCFIALLLFLD